MRRLLVKVMMSVALVGFAASVRAQMQAPKPAPELKKLDYFVGDWKAEEEVKASPMGPGGKVTTNETWGWMEGGFFLEVRARFTSAAMGNGSAAAYMGYDTDKKVYTYDEFNSMGEAIHSTGTVEGNTWTWLGPAKMGTQMMKGRFTILVVSLTSYTYKFEVSQDGTTWNEIVNGKATKVK